ncbi:hypothetical protein FHS23_004589 [Prauserella isguenensis]|uniref:Uncharacterized protein n=1 Tax=Prauserella isguenensis TaxID=1470180 RepID=A0A839S6N8_9PSEU|nr:hypothetical protein [Prauserella isguenensis]MBB3053535.1 hypothetical protein [Prauserella isguenensis]
MTPEAAPGGPGRPELMCVAATGGLSVHLFDPDANEVLCRGLRSGKIGVGTRLSFQDSGCRRCARTAAARGYQDLITSNGERIPLEGFSPSIDQ